MLRKTTPTKTKYKDLFPSGGTNDGCSGQRPSGARGGAIRGARAGFDERRANRREEARDDDGARGGAWRGAAAVTTPTTHSHEAEVA
jgi:hypothetical protein